MKKISLNTKDPRLLAKKILNGLKKTTLPAEIEIREITTRSEGSVMEFTVEVKKGEIFSHFSGIFLFHEESLELELTIPKVLLSTINEDKVSNFVFKKLEELNQSIF